MKVHTKLCLMKPSRLEMVFVGKDDCQSCAWSLGKKNDKQHMLLDDRQFIYFRQTIVIICMDFRIDFFTLLFAMAYKSDLHMYVKI